MRIALLADVHLDTPFVWAGPEAGGRWRRTLRETFRAGLERAVSESVDAIFLAGDIYEHDEIRDDTAAFLVSALADVDPTPVLVAPGNHDFLCPSSAWAQRRWSSNVYVFGRDHWQARELAPGFVVWGIAHGVPAGTPNTIHSIAAGARCVNIAMFHGALRSAYSADLGWTAPELHFPFDESDIEAAGIDHAFCGHYHAPRISGRVTYPGNPHPLSFGEIGDRGLVIADIADDGSVTQSIVVVAQGRMHDLLVDVSGAMSSDEVRTRCLSAVGGLRGAGRLTLTGSLNPDVDLDRHELQQLPTQLDALCVRLGAIHPNYDFDALRNENTIRGQFVRDVEASGDLDELERSAIITTGLRALDGREDLEVTW